MQLIDEWKAVLTKAWSMKAAFALAVLGAAQAGLPYFGDFLPPVLMGSLTGTIALLLIVMRLLDQNLAAVADGTATDVPTK